MANNLKRARFNAGMPQIVLWKKTGIHFSTLSRIERGYMDPTKEQVKKLAHALDVDPEWLFPGLVEANKKAATKTWQK